ncbi:lactate/malate family dehydrogenase [Oleisolibacter albus]|uniref:lactate/malate family dehydrogenase n=1 Tax=Oleisolibacter albus TaxID=2171757 RepID=UPI000DF19094|nr:L-lactate dehydrogenase [Oleisolibacter albus]
MSGSIGIVGAGLVGSAAAYLLTLLPGGGDVVLVDIDRNRAEAEAQDIAHAAAFGIGWHVRSGTFEDLAGSDLVVVTAGASLKPGQTRLDLAKTNTGIVMSIIEQVLKHAPEAILLLATNPVDVMPAIAVERFGLKPGRVIGTGCALDSARFRERLARHLNVAAPSVSAYVLGEHGDSEVLHWSAAHVADMPLDHFAQSIGRPIDATLRESITQEVRTSAYRIKVGKGVSNFGIGGCIARLARAILADEQLVFSVSTYLDEVLDVERTCISLPHVLGRNGASRPLMPALDASERTALQSSARVIQSAIASSLAA